MTTEEQIRVIRNWTLRFNINDTNRGNKYGVMTYSQQYGGTSATGPHSTTERVTDAAYEMVRDIVWDIVNDD